MKYIQYSIQDIPENIKQGIHTIQKWEFYSSLWQTPEWTDMLLKTWYISRWDYYVAQNDNRDEILWYACVEIRSIWFGFYGAFIIGWPYWNTFSSKEGNPNWFIDFITQEVEKIWVVFLQLEPIQDDMPFIKMSFGAYKKFLTPFTRLVSLIWTEEDILWQMHEKGRYNIRLAEKRWVQVEQVINNPENRDIFFDLLQETTARDGFSQNSKRYYSDMLNMLVSHDMGWLYFASYHNEIIAAGIFVYYGNTALYYYWASTSDRELRKHMPTYLLQWKAIQDAKERGCTQYDFLGVADPENPRDSLWGVTDFKNKFWWELKKWPQKYLIISRPFIYRIIVLLRWIKGLL